MVGKLVLGQGHGWDDDKIDRALHSQLAVNSASEPRARTTPAESPTEPGEERPSLRRRSMVPAPDQDPLDSRFSS